MKFFSRQVRVLGSLKLSFMVVVVWSVDLTMGRYWYRTWTADVNYGLLKFTGSFLCNVDKSISYWIELVPNSGPVNCEGPGRSPVVYPRLHNSSIDNRHRTHKICKCRVYMTFVLSNSRTPKIPINIRTELRIIIQYRCIHATHLNSISSG